MKKSILLSLLTAGVMSGALFAEDMKKEMPETPAAPAAVAAPATTTPAPAKPVMHKKRHKAAVKKEEVKPAESMTK